MIVHLASSNPKVGVCGAPMCSDPSPGPRTVCMSCTPTPCSVPDCNGSVHALGFCRRHYDRQHTYGDLNLDNVRGPEPEPAPPVKPAVLLPRRIARPYCLSCGMAKGHWLGCDWTGCEVAA